MIDFLALIIGFFLICFLILILAVGLTLIYRIFKLKIPSPKDSHDEQEEDKQVQEDSEGDGLVLFDDPLFPEEFDDDDDY